MTDAGSRPLFLTPTDPAPAGWHHVVLAKRHLLAGPVAVLVDDLAQWWAVSAGFGERLNGLVLTPSTGEPHCERLSPLAWHLTVPPERVAAAPLLFGGWLEAIGDADAKAQALFALEHRMERVGREFELTRHDYNELTGRLQQQVQQLLAKEAELGRLNETLEARVVERTADLGRANEGLYEALAELKATQNELLKSAELAHLGALVAGIAHELNTPIGNALTVATALSHETAQLRHERDIGGIRRSSLDRLLDRVDEIALVLEKNLVRAADIIHHTKPLAVDRLSEQRRRFKVGEVIDDTLAALSPQLKRAPVTLALEVDGAVEMDSFPGAFSTVLSNLVTNALTHAFTDRTQGRMQLRARPCDDGQLELVFSDDGAGMTPAVLGRIFEPFFTTQLGRGGSGLGLYIAYNQVRRMLGGHISVTSTVGRGTSFRLLLPTVAPQAA
jgi:signal transduction histidine kinase